MSRRVCATGEGSGGLSPAGGSMQVHAQGTFQASEGGWGWVWDPFEGWNLGALRGAPFRTVEGGSRGRLASQRAGLESPRWTGKQMVGRPGAGLSGVWA